MSSKLTMKDVMTANCRISNEVMPTSNHCAALARELNAIIAAPVVERQPVAEVQHGPFDDVGAPQWVRVATLGDFDLENFPDGTKFYTAPPELAELQAKNEQLGEAHRVAQKQLGDRWVDIKELQATIAQLTAENERLKGGQGELK